jgi:hypothetical protein
MRTRSLDDHVRQRDLKRPARPLFVNRSNALAGAFRTTADLTSPLPDVFSRQGRTVKFAAVNFRWSYGVVDKDD